ncbi:MAG: NAD(+)/NADH kinase [Clostridiales Family XIII bacterium]|jgi:NAD+ kinase|nr:NAD(+)/NADH kinase [Clostridiales Family XIII bacterium]
MDRRVINIIENGAPESARIKHELVKKLEANGFTVSGRFDRSAELIICIGGDGSLLRMLAEHDFPKQPIVGVNTGHLGFFQELDKEDIDVFIENYLAGKYKEQTYRTVYADVIGGSGSGILRVRALNEIVVRGGDSHLAHLNIYIGDSFIEQFCGDGVVISTPAGSTAYNYSLGGSIVDPRIELLQVTPIAPINSTAYRSFTSGIVLPQKLSVVIIPDYPQSKKLLLTADGAETEYAGVKEIRAGLSRDVVTLLRFKDYDFWNTVKRKLL